MKTALFDYDLPSELIAQVPAERRDASRLLVVERKSQSVAHHHFADLPQFARRGDCMIRNVARVLPARLFGRRHPGGGRVECLLLRPADGGEHSWWCLLRPGRRLPPGTVFGLENVFEARVAEKSPEAEYRVDFRPAVPGDSVPAIAERVGQIPLPPYVDRHDMSDDERARATKADHDRYQTVFADRMRTVAVAAPTAGLHFTDELMARLADGGVTFADVVLHVGLGTFRPIETEEVADHPIHRERIEIPASTRARLDGPVAGRRIAVGTTSVRTLETYASASDAALPHGEGFTAEADLFIHPPYDFQKVDALITNFHLPRSTLLCLVAAFLTPGRVDGVAWMREIYAEAVRERYRFLSYGDAMLIV